VEGADVSERSKDELYELVAYLVTCSRLTLDEPQVYGSYRLIEAVVRIVEAAPALGLTIDDSILAVHDSIQREKMRMIEDHDGYRTWLDGLIADVASEATRRNLAQPPA
jgi:Family of unknown function (DUF6092)